MVLCTEGAQTDTQTDEQVWGKAQQADLDEVKFKELSAIRGHSADE